MRYYCIKQCFYGKRELARIWSPGEILETKEGDDAPSEELFSKEPYVPPKFDPPGPKAFSEMRAENVVFDGNPIALSQLAEKQVKPPEQTTEDSVKPTVTGDAAKAAVKRGQRS